MRHGRVFPPLLLAALTACAGGAKARKGAPAGAVPELDLYLEQFDAVKGVGADIYLQASAIAEDKGGEKLEERRKAFESRLQSLRIIDKYNRVLVGLALGEDPKSLKSGMKEIGSKLASYRPSAQSTFAFAAAVPYLGTVVAGAGLVQEALAKRRFKAAVRQAQQPIHAILDLLLLDSEPLETLLVEQVKLEQDAPRAAVDSLSGRFYKRLTALKTSPELEELIAAFNAKRRAAGMDPVPHAPEESAAAPSPADLEYLDALGEQAALNLQEYRRADQRANDRRALFAGYRAALNAAKGAFAALNGASDAQLVAATREFNAQALGVRQQSVKLREANR